MHSVIKNQRSKTLIYLQHIKTKNVDLTKPQDVSNYKSTYLLFLFSNQITLPKLWPELTAMIIVQHSHWKIIFTQHVLTAEIDTLKQWLKQQKLFCVHKEQDMLLKGCLSCVSLAMIIWRNVYCARICIFSILTILDVTNN